MSAVVYRWVRCRCPKCGARHRDVVPNATKEQIGGKAVAVICDRCSFPGAGLALARYHEHRVRLAGNDPLAPTSNKDEV